MTEHQQPNHTLVDVFTVPEDRLLTANLINATVTVEVPVSSSVNDETQVHFVNSRDRAQLKMCKALGPGSDALNGQTFQFSVVDLDGFQRDPLNPSVTASSAGTQCVIVGLFPVGHNVEVKELLDHGPGDAGEFIDTTGEGTIRSPRVSTRSRSRTRPVACSRSARRRSPICGRLRRSRRSSSASTGRGARSWCRRASARRPGGWRSARTP